MKDIKDQNTQDLLLVEPDKQTLNALGLKATVAYVPTVKAATDKASVKKARNLERQKRHQEKLKEAGNVNAWVPADIAEAIKAGVKLIPADTINATIEAAAIVPEPILAFANTNGWDKVESSLALRKRIKALPAWKRTLIKWLGA